MSDFEESETRYNIIDGPFRGFRQIIIGFFRIRTSTMDFIHD